MNVNLGGVSNGFPREDKFDITVASEIMAIFCLATSIKDLKEKHISVLDLDGIKNNKIKPSSEVDLHLMLYKNRDEIRNEKVKILKDLISNPKCFGKNLNGSPKHPLYLPKNIQLISYR